MDETSATTLLPQVISDYQAAHDRHDAAAALAQFADDAVVTDDGHTYAGIDEIEAFIRTAAGEYTFTRTLIDAAEIAPGEWKLTNRLQGDFPGGTVDLSYRFRLDFGRIARLDIAP